MTPRVVPPASGSCTSWPVVLTTSNAQAIEAQRLLDELGDDVPETTLNVRKLRSLAAQQRREAIDAAPIAKLPSRIKLKHCSYDELRLKPESVSLILTDPPWSQDRDTLSLWEGLGAMAGRVLQPEGMLLTYVGQAGLPRWLSVARPSASVNWQRTSHGLNRAMRRRGTSETTSGESAR
jgi:hypothetical protein